MNANLMKGFFHVGYALLVSALVAMNAMAAPVTGAAFTTVVTGEESHCKNGNPLVNCNIYDGKEYVWLNGGPISAYIGDGTYFFAVLTPGGQNDPNDGGANNLSDDFDSYTNRTFTVSGGNIVAYGGDHALSLDNKKIQLFPYAPTTNPGGVYIMAICSVADGYPVTPSKCKYDMFKIQPPGTASLVVCKFNDKDNNGAFNGEDEYLGGWEIDAVGVVDGSGNTGFVSQLTSDVNGCTSFTVKDFADPVRVQEGFQDNWQQSALIVSTPNYTQDAYGVVTVSIAAGDVVTVTFGNHSDGNTCPTCPRGNVTADKTATPHIAIKEWHITKDVDKTKVTQPASANDTATFNYTVKVWYDGTLSLTGDITVTNNRMLPTTGIQGVTVTDNPGNGGTCVVTPPSGNGSTDASGNAVGMTLPPESSVKLTYVCTFPDGTSLTTKGTNTVSVIGSDGITVIASNVADYDFGAPDVQPTTTVNVTDTLAGPWTGPGTFTYPYTVTGTAGSCVDKNNTAAITETGQTASQKVTLCIAKDLTVEKGATPTFTRTYKWSIAKSVDKTSLVEAGGSTTFNYSVTATETGFQDSAWAVTGTIKVSNPNDFEDIVADVSDAISNGGSCSVTGGAGITIPKSGSKTLNYSCSYPDSGPTTPTAMFTNTGTATWTSSTAKTPTGSASGTVTGNFATPAAGNPTKVDATITVTDTYTLNGGTPTATALTPSLTAVDATPYTTKTWTYSRTLAPAQGACASASNTASINDTPAQTTAPVNTAACNTKTNALTMGFWQGPNGQKTIGTSSTSGTCSAVIGFLGGYAPFTSDMSSKKSCSALNSYINTLVNNANSSGGGTAMLKGQMLATALTSYYSSTTGNSCGFAGNGTNTVASQGTVANLACVRIQLNPIKGTENDGAGFGWAATGSVVRTVAQLLADASSQWAGYSTCTSSTCKANTVLASSAFNYINNSQANIAP